MHQQVLRDREGHGRVGLAEHDEQLDDLGQPEAEPSRVSGDGGAQHAVGANASNASNGNEPSASCSAAREAIRARAPSMPG